MRPFNTKPKHERFDMQKQLLVLAVSAFAGSLVAANAGPKDEAPAATKKLGEQTSYSWHTTVVVPESAQFKPGPTDGKTEKDGFTHVKMRFRENTTELVLKGDKSVFTSPDGDWVTPAEAENDQGP